jgi:hypothetical protein
MKTENITIYFDSEYDFSDSHFEELKTKYFENLINNFIIGIDKARVKTTYHKREIDLILSRRKINFECFGINLLENFKTKYEIGENSVQSIISSCSEFLFEDSASWVEIYFDRDNKREDLIKRLNIHVTKGFYLEPNWMKENDDFNGVPNETNNCLFDLTNRDAKYYFDKLSYYMAMNQYSDYISKYTINQKPSASDDVLNKNYTVRRQILALHYLLAELGMKAAYTNKTDFAKLAHLLSAKDFTKISNSSIYQKLKTISLNDKAEQADYKFVLQHFGALNTSSGSIFDRIVSSIKKDIQ